MRPKKDKSGSGRLFCPAAGRCGGCSLLDVPYERQLREKQAAVTDLLKDFCPVRPIIGMEDPLHYRNKVHAAFGVRRDGSIFSGTYEENSHRIVPVKECLIENREADAIVATVRELARSFRLRIYDEDRGTGFLRHILIRTAHATKQVMVVLVTADPAFPGKRNFLKALLKAHPEITTVVQNINHARTSMILGARSQTLYGPGWIEDVLCGLRFRISPSSFYQVNSVQTERLYGEAVRLAGLTGKERVIDAYCGTGTIGLIAASHAREVVGIELNREAVRDAVGNARRNGIDNIRFLCADATEALGEMAGAGAGADVLFLDPPRSGSTEAFLRSASRLKPQRIVYISCNPLTLARDLGVLRALGYHAKEAVPVDMFCFCEHVECVVLMSRVTK